MTHNYANKNEEQPEALLEEFSKNNTGSPSELFRHSTTEKQLIRPRGHPGTAYVVVWKVGVIHNYASKNEEQPEALLEEFSRLLRNQDISVRHLLFWSSCLITHP